MQPGEIFTFRDTLDFRLVSPNGREKSVGANEDERFVMGVDQVGLHWLQSGATKVPLVVTGMRMSGHLVSWILKRLPHRQFAAAEPDVVGGLHCDYSYGAALDQSPSSIRIASDSIASQSLCSANGFR